MARIGYDIPQALAAQTLAAPYSADAGSGGGTFLTAQFLTLVADAGLTAERVFTPGSGLAGADSGAGAAYTLSVDATIPRTTVTLTAGAGLAGGGDLSANRTFDVGAGTGITVNANDVAVDQATAFAWTGLQTWSQVAAFNAGANIAFGTFLRFAPGANEVRLFSNVNDVLNLGAGDSFRSATYTSGLAGWAIAADGTAEFSNVRVRGELSASVFKVSEITATAGTFGVFKSAAALYADYTAPGSIGASNATMQAKNSQLGASLFAVGDIIRIKSWDGTAIRDLWLTVTSVGANSGAYTTYTCRLESGTVGATFTAGTAIADYGPTGAGFVTLSADGTLGSSANLSIADHAGAPWTTQTLRVRLGNLNGSYGVVTDVHGLGVGDYAAGNYLKYNTTDGFVLKAGGGLVTIDGTGIKIAVSTVQTATRSVSFTTAGAMVYNGIFGLETATAVQIAVRSEADTGNARDATASLSTQAQTGHVADTLMGAGIAGGNFIGLDLLAVGANIYAALSAYSGTLTGMIIGGISAPNAMLDVRGTLYNTVSDAGTGGVVTNIITHNSSAAALAGFGAATRVNLKTSTTNDTNASYDSVEWVVPTHASRTARRVFYVYDSVTSREFLRGEASGTAPMIGFYGHAAVAQPAAPVTLADVIAIIRGNGLSA